MSETDGGEKSLCRCVISRSPVMRAERCGVDFAVFVRLTAGERGLRWPTGRNHFAEVRRMTSREPRIERVFHPSDFTDLSDVAFAHALKLALAGQGELTILHTAPDADDSHWADFPGVRRWLERWGLLHARSTREDVARLGLEVVKVAAKRDDPVEAILHFLKKYPHDLIVLATHQYAGLERWLHRAVAEPVARQAGAMTLFVPLYAEGFVSPGDGEVNLFNVLIPVDRRPPPQAAVDAAATVAGLCGCRDVVFTALHVGPEEDFPRLRFPEGEGWQWLESSRQGGVEQQILKAADDSDVDLIVMATEGHHGFLDALRGSTTERVVRAANCPVLAVPAGAAAGENPREARAWQPAT
jgi:nucleotide-binding universal stress UspA family protein